MNKNSILLKRLTRVGGLSLLVICGSMVVYSMLSSTVEERSIELARARTQLSFKQTEVNTFTNQLENTKDAQAQFGKYLLSRNNTEFSVDVEVVKTLLNRLRDQLRLGKDLRLSLSNEIELKDTTLQALPHIVKVREATRLTLTAMTDLHMFTFIDSMLKDMPGIVQITGLKIVRKGEGLDARNLAIIGGGGRPDLAEGEVTFNWYDIQKKTVEQRR